MPKFTLPPEEKPKKDKGMDVATPMTGDWQRRVTLPVNKAILDAVDTDDVVTVTLTGKVTREVSESGQYPEKSLTVNIDSVEVYPESQPRAKKAFARGFKRAMSAKES